MIKYGYQKTIRNSNTYALNGDICFKELSIRRTIILAHAVLYNSETEGFFF